MDIKRYVTPVAAVAACALGMAAPAQAAVAAAPPVPAHLLPMSTSWPAPQRGIVLAYPARTAGARPCLFQTQDGGRHWHRLPAPPVPFPADNDQPDATWAGGVIAVTDGTHIVASGDAGQRWSAVHLRGGPGIGAYVAKLAVAGGRMFALVTANAGGTGSAAVYSGPARGTVLRPVPGLSVTGGIVYGSIAVTGGVQASLGHDYTSGRYWYTRAGDRFVSASPPCPASTSALLGGVREGRPVALCSGSPSDIGAGENDKQVWIAPHLGGVFRPSGTVSDSANQQQFAAATDRTMVIATAAGLVVTFDAGQTWATELTQPNGSYWTDLAFPSRTTGVVVGSTVDNAGALVATVYRTTDTARTWHALTLP